MELDLDDYLPPAPRLPQNRFWWPVQLFDEGVIPLVPYSDDRLQTDFDLHCLYDCGIIKDADVDYWDNSEFNVGLLCGTPSGVTVLEVTSRSGQRWLDEQDLPCTPHTGSVAALVATCSSAPHLLSQSRNCDREFAF